LLWSTWVMARAIGLASALRVHRRVGRRAKAGGVASPAPERSNTATPGTLSLSRCCSSQPQGTLCRTRRTRRQVGVDEEDQGVQEAHVVAVKELDACKPGAPYAPAILGY
jgi:hypothetical protein